MLLSQGFEPKTFQLESLGWVLAILTVFFISLTYHLAIEIVATQDWLPLHLGDLCGRKQPARVSPSRPRLCTSSFDRRLFRRPPNKPLLRGPAIP